MTHEEMAQVLESLAARARMEQEEAEHERRAGAAAKHAAREVACEAGAAALRALDTDVDSVVTALYRKFKDWSGRGFTADDVTWCEVRAELLKILPAPPKESV